MEFLDVLVLGLKFTKGVIQLRGVSRGEAFVCSGISNGTGKNLKIFLE